MDENLKNVLKGCLKNKRSAQHELYKQFYSYGMSIGIRYMKHEDQAIEVLNDSFMKVFNNMKKYDFDQPFKPWFKRIIVNTALNQMKKNSKLSSIGELNEASHVSLKEEILSKIGYKELLEMVQSLSLGYRTVFNMYVIDGYKHEEISNELGISVGASKSNLHKARAILQKRITKQIEVNYG